LRKHIWRCVGTSKVKVLIAFEPKQLEQIDRDRGIVPRSAWVREMLDKHVLESSNHYWRTEA
jgi:hypothetical protein